MAGNIVTVQRAFHGTLTANTIDQITVLNPWPSVTVVNRGTSEIYFSVGTPAQLPINPTVAGGTAPGASTCFVVPGANGSSLNVPVPQEAFTPPQGFIVYAVSSSTPAYSIEAV